MSAVQFYPSSNCYTEVKNRLTTTKTTNPTFKVNDTSSSASIQSLKDRVSSLKEYEKTLNEANSISGQAWIGLEIVGGLLTIAAGIALLAFAVFGFCCVIPDLNFTMLLGQLAGSLIVAGAVVIGDALSDRDDLEDSFAYEKENLEKDLAMRLRTSRNKAEIAELQEVMSEVTSICVNNS